MTRLAFLGLGAMGSRMAARLLAAGHEVCVWNRSPESAVALQALGASVAPTPAAAAHGASVVFSMVRDDEASRAAWQAPESGALHALSPQAVAVECSTLTVERVGELAAAVATRGALLVDAPLAGTRPQAEAGTLIFLAGGTAEAVEGIRPLLMAMGQAVHHTGDTGTGMALKLMVNGLLGAQVAMLAEMLAFGTRLGVPAARAAAILAELPVTSPAARVAADSLVQRQFAPLFPVELVEKDFACISASGEGHAAHLPLTTALQALYARALTAGHGDAHITAVARLYDTAD